MAPPTKASFRTISRRECWPRLPWAPSLWAAALATAAITNGFFSWGEVSELDNAIAIVIGNWGAALLAEIAKHFHRFGLAQHALAQQHLHQARRAISGPGRRLVACRKWFPKNRAWRKTQFFQPTRQQRTLCGREFREHQTHPGTCMPRTDVRQNV